MEQHDPTHLDTGNPMTYWWTRKIKFDGISVIAFFLFLSWILVSLAWCRRYNPGYLLWFCDVALLMTAVGLFLRSGMLVTAQLVAILVFHIGWNLDFWLYLFFGYLPIGSTAYMFYHDLTLFEKSLSFFNHVFIVPAALSGIYVLGVSNKAWLVQWAQTFLIFLLTYLFTRPAENINWMFGTEIFNITPAIVQPFLYYALMIIVPTLIIYWPTNRLIVFIVNRWNAKIREGTHLSNPMLEDIVQARARSIPSHVSLLTATAAIFLATVASLAVSHMADMKCALDSTIFQVTHNGRSPLGVMPLPTIKTRVDHIIFGERDTIREVSLFVWASQELPKQWSGFDHKWHVHTKALLRYVKAEHIPSVPQEVLLRGTRSVSGSVVWAFVASDSFYIQDNCDLRGNRKTYEVRCTIGGRGVSEYVNPSNGEIYPSTAYNEILGSGTGATYALGVIEVLGEKVVSRSPYYLVKRKGIRFPEDVWFVSKGRSLFPLLSNPAKPMLSRVAFQSLPNPANDTPDIFTCNFFGYEIRNLTRNPRRFDGFVALNGKPFEGIGWAGPDIIRYWTEREGKLMLLDIKDH